MSASSTSTRTIVSIIVVVAVAVGFWMLLLGPKRDKASKLGTEVESAQASLTQATSAASEATAAQQNFDSDYRQLVALGQAVPANEETPSLIVELSHIAKRTHVAFQSLQLNSEGGAAETATAGITTEVGPTASVPPSSTVPPTEAEAALLPLGAKIGAAGLGVMPYSLSFEGGFFDIAKFIHEVDGLVRTEKNQVGVRGRLITVDGFSLSGVESTAPGRLTASVAVTTYLVPPGQGITPGATAEPLAPVAAEPGATEETTTATPSAFSTGSETGAR